MTGKTSARDDTRTHLGAKVLHRLKVDGETPQLALELLALLITGSQKLVHVCTAFSELLLHTFKRPLEGFRNVLGEEFSKRVRGQSAGARASAASSVNHRNTGGLVGLVSPCGYLHNVSPKP